MGRRIRAVDWRPAAFRRASPRPFAELEGQRVARVDRTAKFLFVRTDAGHTWLVHLGMTGKLHFAAPDEAERPHTHLRLVLDDRRELRFSDPRRFGVLRLFAPGAPVPDADHYGVDALSPRFSPEILAGLLATSRAPLKAFLLDQTKVAGLGNIYACEALWRAHLSPRRRACNTPKARVGPLHGAMKGVLEDALAMGGTSFNDYVDHIGAPGRFITDLAVFQREAQPCPRCSAPIQRIVQSGRSTFFCPRCQR